MLSAQLAERADRGAPVRVALIGAGAFGSMFLSQARLVRGLHVVAVCDLDPSRARAALARTGYPTEAIGTQGLATAVRNGATWVTDDAAAILEPGVVDVVVEATGSPAAAVRHCLAAYAAGVHVANVTVEADALLGPILGERARAAGVVHTYASGDQPALICELVDWARVNGLEVVSAGKGTKYLPAYHVSTPATVWGHYGIDPAHAAAHGLNPVMFNSFLDGTKSAIEMAAVANATGLVPQEDGLRFPPSSAERLASVCIPEEAGGLLGRRGTVEVVSSLERDGTEIDGDLRWGVYVVFAAPSDFVRDRFLEYGLAVDPTGRFAALWRPHHLIGLELGTSVARAALRGEASGSPDAFHADVVAVAKRSLRTGETLDGEGGEHVWGRLRPAARSLAGAELPIGLAHGVRLVRDVPADSTLTYADVALDETDEVVRLRRELERRGPAAA
ncbi:MAG: flagellar biosynthesis protein FlgA [Thermoleophilia bacterium]